LFVASRWLRAEASGFFNSSGSERVAVANRTEREHQIARSLPVAASRGPRIVQRVALAASGSERENRADSR